MIKNQVSPRLQMLKKVRGNSLFRRPNLEPIDTENSMQNQDIINH